MGAAGAVAQVRNWRLSRKISRSRNARQHPQRRYEHSLRLLDPHRSSAPALHSPLADRTLQPDDMPDAAHGRAAEAEPRGAKTLRTRMRWIYLIAMRSEERRVGKECRAR